MADDALVTDEELPIAPDVPDIDPAGYEPGEWQDVPATETPPADPTLPEATQGAKPVEEAPQAATLAGTDPIGSPSEPLIHETRVRQAMDAIRSVENWAAHSVDELAAWLELEYTHATEALRRLTATL